MGVRVRVVRVARVDAVGEDCGVVRVVVVAPPGGLISLEWWWSVEF